MLFLAFTDNILAISLYIPDDVATELKAQFKALRLIQGLTQEGLALRSGVSLGSLKRFEATGQISLESLLRLVQALGRIDDFYRFAQSLAPQTPLTLEDVAGKPALPKRGRRT
jgi:transcriptional regulator with XRE-family HTH domain